MKHSAGTSSDEHGGTDDDALMHSGILGLALAAFPFPFSPPLTLLSSQLNQSPAPVSVHLRSHSRQPNLGLGLCRIFHRQLGWPSRLDLGLQGCVGFGIESRGPLLRVKQSPCKGYFLPHLSLGSVLQQYSFRHGEIN